MRDVAIVSFAQAPSVRREPARNDVEMLMPVIAEALARSNVKRDRIGFWCSGSTDFITGQPFSFVGALDAVGAWPPISESHVEMDGAWALYEAWIRMQHENLDAAVVYAFGRSSLGPVPDVMCMQLDPYILTPLWPDAVSLAALQARAYLEASGKTERDLAQVAIRNRKNAKTNPNAQVKGDSDVESLLAEPYIASPLRAHDCPPISDACAVVVLAAGDYAREVCKRPAWIRGIDHRIEAQYPGARDLTRSSSTAIAAEKAGVAKGGVDVAEIYAPFTSQELIVLDALKLPAGAEVNPSGGALAAHPIMSAGLIRMGEVASRIHTGEAKRGVAHATSGPCLQQNLVCVLEGA